MLEVMILKGEKLMLRTRFYSSFVAVAVMLGMYAAALGQETSKTIMINREAKLAGQTLSKGSYTIKYTEGKDGELIFVKGKQEVVKVAYKWTKLDTTPSGTSVVYSLAEDGSYSIKRIEIKGKEFALVLE
jgi:hypothetical protein